MIPSSKIKMIIAWFTFGIAALVVGAGIGFMLGARRAGPHDEISKAQNDIIELRVAADVHHPLVSQLLGCAVPQARNVDQLVPFKTQLTAFIDSHIKDTDVSMVSVYFDTRDGNWFSINDDEKYSPASLMKVPIMMAFYKFAETHPDILEKKIEFKGGADINKEEYFKPTQVMTPRQSYTVEDLIRRMVVYSDNNAIPLLINTIDDSVVRQVYDDLRISLPSAGDKFNDFITVRTYAGFFRFLYNASYINRDMSERALELLSATDFPKGIRAGVPPTIKVAQKFGERNFSTDPADPQSKKELHDCGVVYAPGQPFLLCIMTKGKNFEKMARSIKDITRFVYDYQTKHQ